MHLQAGSTLKLWIVLGETNLWATLQERVDPAPGCPRPHLFTWLEDLANIWTMCQWFIRVSTAKSDIKRCLRVDVSCLHLCR